MMHRLRGNRLLLAFLPIVWSAQKSPAQDVPQVGGLSTRYRLREVYTSRATTDASGPTGQYQVGLRETTSTDDPAEKAPRVIRAVYTERPAGVSPVDDKVVTDLVRHYETVGLSPDPWAGRPGRRPLNDLTIWRRTIANAPPQVLVLTPGRPLSAEEYRFAISYDFVSNLAFLLPELPVRVGDSWKVPIPGAVALTNGDVHDGDLTAKLDEVRADPDSPGKSLAIINVTGRLVTGYDIDADTAVNARIQFAFTPKAGGEVVDGTGFIAKVSLAQVSTLTIPNETTKRTIKRELTLERKRPGASSPLNVPNPPPSATPENSWLTWTDPPAGRYSFRYPQDMEPALVPGVPGAVDLKLLHPDNGSVEVVRLIFTEKAAVRPEILFKDWLEEFRKQGSEVVPGLSRKVKPPGRTDLMVDHQEAAVTTQMEANTTPLRRYCDLYVIQFAANAHMIANSASAQDPPDPFRKKVLELLATVKLGVPKGP